MIFGNSIRAENLSKDLYIVAGKSFEGRETATEGQRKAAAYIEQVFKSLGLKPGNGVFLSAPIPGIPGQSPLNSNSRKR